MTGGESRENDEKRKRKKGCRKKSRRNDYTCCSNRFRRFQCARQEYDGPERSGRREQASASPCRSSNSAFEEHSHRGGEERSDDGLTARQRGGQRQRDGLGQTR